MRGEPQKELRNEFTPGPVADQALGRDWFHVANQTPHTVTIRVDGRRVGRLGPYATAAFFIGRSAAAERKLRADCEAGRWEGSLRDADVTWHLYE